MGESNSFQQEPDFPTSIPIEEKLINYHYLTSTIG